MPEYVVGAPGTGGRGRTRAHFGVTTGTTGLAFLLALVTATASPALAQQPDSLDLTGWLELARDRSPGLDAAEATVREAEGERRVAESARRPRVETGADYLRFQSPPAVPLGDGGSFAPLAENTYLGRVTLTQPLYTGGRTSATLSAAERGIESTEASSREADVQLTAAVARAYHDVLLAREEEEVHRRSVEVLREAVRVAEEHHGEGTVGRLDVLRAETRLSSARSAHRAAETEVATAREWLAATVGVPLDAAPRVTGALEYAEAEVDPEVLEERARTGRPDVRALQLEAEAERARAEAFRAERRPAVSLHVTGLGSNPEVLTGRSGWSWEVLGGLSVSWPIFDSGEAAGRSGAAEAAAERAEARAEQVADQAVAGVHAALRELGRAGEDVHEGRENVARAERVLALTQERYADGIGIQLDVLEAEADLTRARGDLLRAIHAHRAATIELRRAAGLPADAPLDDVPGGDGQDQPGGGAP